jgi:ankyrin repeat protein
VISPSVLFHEPKLCLLIHLFFSQDTPLHYSALNGHTDVCRLLLENAADVNARNWK